MTDTKKIDVTWSTGTTSDGDQTNVLTIGVNESKSDALQSGAEFLVSKAPSILKRWQQDPSIYFYRICIRLGKNGQLIEEEVMWQQLMCESPKRTGELVLSYLTTICNTAEELKIVSLVYTGTVEYMEIGTFAMIAFIDHFDRSYMSPVTPITLALCRQFVPFIQLCDLDDETRQDNYIHRVSSILLKYDEDSSAYKDLIYYRLFNGQCCLKIQSGQYLRSNMCRGLFRYIVDRALSDDFDGLLDYSHIAYLCAALFGSDETVTEQHISKIELLIGRPLARSLHENSQRSIDIMIAETDSYHKYWPINDGYNTGFYRYNLSTQTWLEC